MEKQEEILLELLQREMGLRRAVPGLRMLIGTGKENKNEYGKITFISKEPNDLVRHFDRFVYLRIFV